MGTDQDDERKLARQGGSQTVKRRGREKSVRTAKIRCHVIERALTSCRAQRAKTQDSEEIEQAGGTHGL